jgi:hypothetical protein
MDSGGFGLIFFLEFKGPKTPVPLALAKDSITSFTAPYHNDPHSLLIITIHVFFPLVVQTGFPTLTQKHIRFNNYYSCFFLLLFLWQQAALVLNASRRFRYTLDLKKEEEKEQIRRKIRAHAQVIRVYFKLMFPQQFCIMLQSPCLMDLV